jgi:hypothetical protein
MNDDSRILISKELVDQIPDFEQISGAVNEFLLFYAKDDSTGVEITGPISSVLFADDPEVEVKMNISDALFVLQHREKISISSLNMAHRKNIIKLEGNYNVHAAKILDVNVDQQSCVLALGLKSTKKEFLKD